jgi:hypothetical protein
MEVEKLKLKKEELNQIGEGTNLINNKLMKVTEMRFAEVLIF